MRITEPMTMVTDYVLGALALVLAFRLFGDAAAGGQLSVRLWAVGVRHDGGRGRSSAARTTGSSSGCPAGAGRALWKMTLLATGARQRLPARPRPSWPRPPARSGAALLVARGRAQAARSTWSVVVTRDNFLLVIADYGSALVAVLLAAWFLRPSGLTPAAGWLTAGVAVSVVAGVIQWVRLAPHPRFNHNDLFHVVQMAALYLPVSGRPAVCAT